MDQHSNYRRKYERKPLDRAYRLFVNGASIRECAKKTKVPSRTISKYSSSDEWVAEREARHEVAAKQAAQDALAASVAAANATEAEIQAELEANPDDLKALTKAVLKRQQKFWDRLEGVAVEALDEIIRKAAEQKRPVPLGQLVPLLKAAELASSGVRKAYGIPDVSKIEWEDKTPAAKRHADVIRQKRLERLAKAAQVPAQKEVSH